MVLMGENNKIKDLIVDGHVVVKDGEVLTGERIDKKYL